MVHRIQCVVDLHWIRVASLESNSAQDRDWSPRLRHVKRSCVLLFSGQGRALCRLHVTIPFSSANTRANSFLTHHAYSGNGRARTASLVLDHQEEGFSGHGVEFDSGRRKRSLRRNPRRRIKDFRKPSPPLDLECESGRVTRPVPVLVFVYCSHVKGAPSSRAVREGGIRECLWLRF